MKIKIKRLKKINHNKMKNKKRINNQNKEERPRSILKKQLQW